MTSVKRTSIGIISALVFSTLFVMARSNTRGKDPVKKAGFAVLELFTSEGCSSCPAADDLLAHVQEEAGDKPIYVLAYHVDYWNRLGWKDKFSSPAFSQRQYQYHDWFASHIYTPQLVVNGRSELVGSDAPAVRRAVEGSLNNDAAVALALHGRQQSGVIDLEYEVAGDNPGQSIAGQLVIAIVQKHAVSRVERGENAGLTLSHSQIVRNLYKFDLTSNKGSVKIDVPEGFDRQDWEVIGMVQDPASGVITAAGRLTLDAAAHR